MQAGLFLEENRSRLGLGGLRLHPAAQSALLAQDWPGNVRELEHLISRGVLRALSRAPSTAPAGGRARMVTLGRADLWDAPQPSAAPAPVTEARTAPSDDRPQGLRDAVESYERQLIEASLQRHHGSWAAAARELQMDRANLQRLARRLGMQ
jgi:anaerobic nitric oxide reductase transcription regulator